MKEVSNLFVEMRDQRNHHGASLLLLISEYDQILIAVEFWVSMNIYEEASKIASGLLYFQ